MNNILKNSQIAYMIKVQDLIANNKKVVKDIVVDICSNKKLPYSEFRVFTLRHGMTNDQQSHSFSEIANKFDCKLIEILKFYNNALKIVAEYLKSTELNNECVK